MFNLFNKKKVFAGKQSNDEKKPAAAVAGAKTEQKDKKPAPFAVLGQTWAKLNKMDRKQAYTWGALAVVVLVALLTLGSVLGGGDEDDFSAFETRGYDLANMPFSADEAEQYLLASKYPDMQNVTAAGLYTKEDKKNRQEEDAEAAAEQAAQLDTSASSTASQYVPGRYYGGGSAGPAAPTQVGTLNSASLKSPSGSAMSGTFGPMGDFSNFRSQDKGRDVFNAQQGRGGDARQALFRTAVGSRAAAGQKDNRLVNAKKAMMGGNIKGSDAFLSDSGAVDLSKAAGLNLDTNAPVSSVDPGLFDDALQDAKQEAAAEAQEEEEEWWETMLHNMAEQFVSGLISMGMNAAQNAMNQAQSGRNAEQIEYQNDLDAAGKDFLAHTDTTKSPALGEFLDGGVGGTGTYQNPPVSQSDGSTSQTSYSWNSQGDAIETTTITKIGSDGKPISTSTTRNLSEEAGQTFSKSSRRITPQDIERQFLAGRHAPQSMSDQIKFDTTTAEGITLVRNRKGDYIGKMDGGKFVSGTYADGAFTAGDTKLGKVSFGGKRQMNRAVKDYMYSVNGNKYEAIRRAGRFNASVSQTNNNQPIYTDSNGRYMLVNGQKQYLKD